MNMFESTKEIETGLWDQKIYIFTGSYIRIYRKYLGKNILLVAFAMFFL